VAVRRRISRGSALAAAVVAVALGAAILFLPSGSCSTVTARPGEAPVAAACPSESLVQRQRDTLFPALLYVAAWALVPLVAPFAVRARERGSERAPGVVAAAMVVEASSIISLGGGFLFALFVAPLLLLCFMTLPALDRDG
jgi:hypothetical protein